METISFEEHAAENKKIVVTLLLDTTQNMGPKKTSINVTVSPTTIYNIDAQSEDIKRHSVNTNAKRFSADPDKVRTEEIRNLLAVHNVTTDQLVEDLKLGGFPMPSPE